VINIIKIVLFNIKLILSQKYTITAKDKNKIPIILLGPEAKRNASWEINNNDPKNAYKGSTYFRLIEYITKGIIEAIITYILLKRNSCELVFIID